MGEINRKVDWIQVDYECDSCKKGLILPTGGETIENGARNYQHTCPNCSQIYQVTGKKYPYSIKRVVETKKGKHD
jgi:predicted RNA-binding Zn-ribbon protein involved in translation (DUF1610 family)